jgi:transcriptional regulator with XRE-family HTH domain
MPQEKMKKIAKIRDQFGLTQSDLALLLRVTRSQLSMYELGKRDLPVAAKEQLVQMLGYVQKNPLRVTTNKALLKEQEEQKRKVLHDLIVVNKHRQLLLDKKINVLERKQHDNLKSLQLVGFLEEHAANGSFADNHIAKIFEMKANSEIAKRSLTTLIKLRLKKEVLAAEELLLAHFLQKLL